MRKRPIEKNLENGTAAVSEPKLTEDPMGETGQRILALIDSITDGIAGIDGDWRFIYANKSAAGFLNKTKEQIIGKKVFQVFPDARETVFEQKFRAALEERKPVSFEAYYEPLKSWFECRCYPAQAGISVLFTDTTAKKRKDKERAELLEEMDRKVSELEAVINTMNEGLSICDMTGNILKMNQRALEVHGFGSSAEIPRRLREYPDIFEVKNLDGDAIPVQEWPLSRVMRGYSFSGLAMRLYRKDTGVERICEYAGAPVLDGAGKPILAIVMVRDITDRKKLEEALALSQLTTAQQLAELEAIYNSAHVGLCVIDTQLRYQRINERMAEINGIPASEHIGKTVRDIVPELAHQAETIFKQVMETRLPVLDIEITGSTHAVSGVVRTWKEQWLPVKDTAGKIVGINVVAEDITELKRAKEILEFRVRERTAQLEKANSELNRYNAQLEILNKELQEFAFVASHDLSEPLRKIQTFGSMLRANLGSRLDDREKDYLLRMEKSADRMQGLLDALLRYSRVTTQNQETVQVDTRQIVHEALSDLELRIEETQARIDVGALPCVNANPVQLRQLFQNLIENSLKFRQDHTPPLIRIFGDTQENGCRIVVQDNGIGFDEKYLPRIFRPFERLHGRDRYEGFGMGLAICKKIVERLGGSICASSKPGGGATFTINLTFSGAVESCNP